MALVLVRHGEAEQAGSSGERGLTDTGRKDVESVAEQLCEAGYKLHLIFHSGKRRAAQTAAILAERIGKEALIEKSAGLDPHDDVAEISRQIERTTVSVAAVGHLPHLSNLVLHLCDIKKTPLFGAADAFVLRRGDPSWEIEEVFRPRA